MTRTTLAVAADYADALLVARRSKNVLSILLLLVLLLQVAVFVLYHSKALEVGSKRNPTSTPAASVTVTPSGATADAGSSRLSDITPGIYNWVLNMTTFLGIVFIVTLAVVMLLTAVIMLVGRLIGVSHVTSAFVWSVLLALILFPWQSLLNSGSAAAATPAVSAASTSTEVEQARYTSPAVKDTKFPGVLVTWTEMERDGRFFDNHVDAETVLHWMRFVGWPVVAMLLLLMVWGKSGRGLRFALGEADIPVEVNAVKPVTDTGL